MTTKPVFKCTGLVFLYNIQLTKAYIIDKILLEKERGKDYDFLSKRLF